MARFDCLSDRMHRNDRNWLSRLACVLGLLLISQFALAAQPCMAEQGVEMSMSHVQSARCLDAKVTVDLCAVNAQRSEVAAVLYGPSDPLPVAAPAPGAIRMAAPRAGAASLAGLSPGYPPPVHILLRRFLS